MKKLVQNWKTEKLTIEEKKYPKKLLLSKYPPKTLYFRGDINLLKEELLLGVVGTRTPTEYGKNALKRILEPLVKKRVIIVSGLAFGIDFLSHKLALDFSSKTVAVMAGGLDNVYPGEHRKTALEILEKGGLILSEHPDQTPYLRQYFPARNRIIAGISDGVLVVEAKKKSGSLITADFAFSNKKKVFSIPGSIFSLESEGTNYLFQKGALPILSSQDIFNFHQDPKVSLQEQNSQIESDLTEKEKTILKNLFFEQSVSLGEIIKKSGLKTPETISLMTGLELKGVIKETGGSRFTKIR